MIVTKNILGSDVPITEKYRCQWGFGDFILVKRIGPFVHIQTSTGGNAIEIVIQPEELENFREDINNLIDEAIKHRGE